MNGMAAFAAPVVFPLLGKRDIKTRMDLLKAKAQGSQA